MVLFSKILAKPTLKPISKSPFWGSGGVPEESRKVRGRPGASWKSPGVVLGSSGAVLKRPGTLFWGSPGAVLEGPGAVLARLGEVLGHPGGVLGASGGLPGASSAVLDASWDRLGASRSRLGRHFLASFVEHVWGFILVTFSFHFGPFGEPNSIEKRIQNHGG